MFGNLQDDYATLPCMQNDFALSLFFVDFTVGLLYYIIALILYFRFLIFLVVGEQARRNAQESRKDSFVDKTSGALGYLSDNRVF